jgi:hypothetical protein
VLCEHLIQSTQETYDMRKISAGVCTGKCLGLYSIIPVHSDVCTGLCDEKDIGEQEEGNRVEDER